MGGGLADGLATGGQAVGAGIGSWSFYRLVVFGCNFFAARHDARSKRLDEQEARLSLSLGQRLDHLERMEKNNQDLIKISNERIRVLEDCVAILAAELRMREPANPKLGEVAKMLRDVHPILPPDPMLDQLLQHAANAVERKPGK